MSVGERVVATVLNLLLGAGVGALAGCLGYAMPCGEFVFEAVVWSALLYGFAALVFGPDYGEEFAVTLFVWVFLVIIVLMASGFFGKDPKFARKGGLYLLAIWVVGLALLLIRAYRARCA
jgi:Ca2+/Na+ antiporter